MVHWGPLLYDIVPTPAAITTLAQVYASSSVIVQQPLFFLSFRPKGEIFCPGIVYFPIKISPWPRPGFSPLDIVQLLSLQGGHIRSK